MPTKERWAAMSQDEKHKCTLDMREWRRKNKEKWNEYQRTKYLESVGGTLSRMSPLIPADIKAKYQKQQKTKSVVAWQKANPEKLKQYYTVSKESGQVAFRAAKRRAAKKQATPKWADLSLIKDVYKEAAYFQMHVDHIYPLQSDWVCGLHVWDNLQLLTAAVNISKGNKQTAGGL